MSRDLQLLDQIAAGELDQQLIAIADAVQARLELLHTVSSANALDELSVGDTVMFTANVRPRYVEHELAVIEALDDRSVTADSGDPSDDSETERCAAPAARRAQALRPTLTLSLGARVPREGG